MSRPASADTRLSELATQLPAKQAAYLAAKGRYWQGIRTHAVPPADGAKTAPNKAVRPTDQAEDWTAFGAVLPATLEVALAVDVYDGPLGKGYVVRAEIIDAGQRTVRAVQIGPETWRTHGWQTMGGTP